MQLKHITLVALASYAFAQDSSEPQSLNATLSGNEQLSNLTSFLGLAPELLIALSNATNITILAPSNEAFAAFANSSAAASVASDPGLLAAVLQYHVLNGTYTASQITKMSAFVPTLLTNETYANVTGGQVVEAVTIGNETVFYSGLLQNATVSQANVNFTGGVVHIIDRVLTLPANVYDTAGAANLTSLRGAANATNLLDTVNNTPDITIFAPTNEAFNSVGDSLESLSEEDLANVLGYHVVVGTVAYSSTLGNGTSVQASNGGNLTITIDGNGTVFVNSARVLTPNVLVANGVVHIIDNVLNPDSTAAPSESVTTGAPAFSTGTPDSEAPFTSGQPEPTTTITPTTEGAGPAASTAASSSSSAGTMPQMTGAVGYGALFGAGAAVFFGAQ
ncbi:FAS1 domain-containing protein [Lentithecium fluviatile CBS 122367]|uniref:FAS1 domain-containing protein n=1 Tax=Lentithecium fluviatile CBS 122367 TaxID=1168545 RepID=A0A6G1J9F0_9PLEO|nr:FAS1 domain-containing protein [Lentithecium fluviatile CBS 122367]